MSSIMDTAVRKATRLDYQAPKPKHLNSMKIILLLFSIYNDSHHRYHHPPFLLLVLLFYLY